MNPGPLHWEHGVLTAGPQEKYPAPSLLPCIFLRKSQSLSPSLDPQAPVCSFWSGALHEKGLISSPALNPRPFHGRCDSAQAGSLSPERPLLPSIAQFSGIFPPQVFLNLLTLHVPPKCHETTSGKQLCHHSNIRSYLLGAAHARCCSKSFTCMNMFSPHNTLIRHVLSPSP